MSQVLSICVVHGFLLDILGATEVFRLLFLHTADLLVHQIIYIFIVLGLVAAFGWSLIRRYSILFQTVTKFRLQRLTDLRMYISLHLDHILVFLLCVTDSLLLETFEELTDSAYCIDFNFLR